MSRATKHPQLPRQRGARRVRRRAAAMAAVLICLLVILLIGGTLVRGMLLNHRQAKHELLQLQTLWLSDSAAALAVEQLRADPGYTGQAWRVTVDETAASVGIAEIQVEQVDQQPQQRLVRIRSTYPDDPHQRVVRENEFIVTLPVLGDSE